MYNLIFLVNSSLGKSNFNEVITTKLVVALAIIFLLLLVSDLSGRGKKPSKQERNS